MFRVDLTDHLKQIAKLQGGIQLSGFLRLVQPERGLSYL